MNERMKIIVKKAHEYADQHWREDGYPFFEEYHQVFSNNYQQKFAELIVRECAELMEKQHSWITNVAASNLIRKHFGVQE
jgi:hypothetical protein